jgi:4-hydroxybenzoate polyprenyltransferase
LEAESAFTVHRRLLLRALRPSHWLKNLLVFVPLAAALSRNEEKLVFRSVIAFVSLGLCASAGYLLNDLIDLKADRHHPSKRNRPFASGDLPLIYGVWAIPLLFAVSCLLAVKTSPLFALILTGYFTMSLAYSLRIKRIAVLDVLFLAGLYTIRIIAGSAATHIPCSYWLLAFSMFLFFSLALVKRYSELTIVKRLDGDSARARAYEQTDGELLAMMGTASGYLSVLVLALYIANDKAPLFYSMRQLLWFDCPLLLYWISHVWLTAHRGRMADDPVVFALSDRTSRVLLLLMATFALGAL